MTQRTQTPPRTGRTALPFSRRIFPGDTARLLFGFLILTALTGQLLPAGRRLPVCRRPLCGQDEREPRLLNALHLPATDGIPAARTRRQLQIQQSPDAPSHDFLPSVPLPSPAPHRRIFSAQNSRQQPGDTPADSGLPARASPCALCPCI